jgi:hypothetical protein
VLRKSLNAAHAVTVDDHDFARLVADKFGVIKSSAQVRSPAPRTSTDRAAGEVMDLPPITPCPS